MKVYDKYGNLLTEPIIKAQDIRLGQQVIYVMDSEAKDIQGQQLRLLRIIAYHLGVITGEVIKEDNLDA